MTITTPLYAQAIEQAPRSSLVDGFNHVALLSHDLDRLIAFYRDCFDVPFVFEPGEAAFRHGYFMFGAEPAMRDVLHVFEVDDTLTGEFADPAQMFRRGRLDHFGLQAENEQALSAIRDRLVAGGHSDGVVTLLGSWMLSVHFVDPDGVHLEVCCARDGSVFGEDDVVRRY